MNLFQDLPSKHQMALKWFLNNAGKTVDWPGVLSDGTLLVTKAKGIYKPHWSQYALSIRQNLNSPYENKNNLHFSGESWKYKYSPEIIEGKAIQDNYTNKALLRNMKDKVPVGILIQTRSKPKSLYKVLGLGLVKEWRNDAFIIDSTISSG